MNLSSSVLPMFPLPEFLLVPGIEQRLRLFEPRYLQMMEDLLDSSGLLVFGTVMGEHRAQLGGSPPVESIGGLGEIRKYERLPNGHYAVSVLGRERVRIFETESDRPYRKVEVEILNSAIEDSGVEEQYREQLLKAIEERSQVPLELPDGISAGLLADMLLIQLPLTFEARYRIYALESVTERIEVVLNFARGAESF